MKRILKITIILSLIFSVYILLCSCENSNGYSSGLKYVSDGNGTCYVSGIGYCKDSHLKIPKKSPKGEEVTGIGKNAFAGCSDLISVDIPSSVHTIEQGAFQDCENLQSVTFAEGVSIIRQRAFMGTALTNVELPESISSIEVQAFSSYSLQSVKIYSRDYNFLLKLYIGDASDPTFDPVRRIFPIFPPETVIYAYKGTQAEEYVKIISEEYGAYGYENKFIPLD